MVHWFNPVVWAAYFMICRDMEMACDESVMGKLGELKKKDYSLALLHFEERRSLLLIPLAFGESHTKSRIKNILNYKKPGFWANLAAIFLLAFAVWALLTDPQNGRTAGKAASSVGIIGGADGPTSIFLAGKIGGDSGGNEAEMADVGKIKGESYGTDVELDYVSAGKISLHGYFGYLSFVLPQAGSQGLHLELYRAATLSEAGPIRMQGDGYTEIIGGDGVAMILPEFYNSKVERKSVYLYYEEDNTIECLDNLEEDQLQNFVGAIRGSAGTDERKSLTDAKIEEPLLGELSELVSREYGAGVLYGPVVIPEFNSNTYGFLAADGGNVGDIWYGIWGRDIGRVTKLRLFDEEP